MPSLPLQLQRVGVPPIKCQGIKTKLVPFILSQIQWCDNGTATWVEPFLGSGAIVFNLRPQRALLADSNHHIIRFYQAIQNQTIQRVTVEKFLMAEGEKLQQRGADYYYEVRERFNRWAEPLDFLFLNRSCFNGLIRFNRNGQFNVPFCHKLGRFSRSYITKIANQVDWAARQMAGQAWEFRVSSWQDTLQTLQPQDFIYLDPPYIGRHADYYNTWTELEAKKLAVLTRQLPCGFAVSMWLENAHRKNGHISHDWPDVELRPFHHFYHVGSKETWRGSVIEALLLKPGYAASPANETVICPL